MNNYTSGTKLQDLDEIENKENGEKSFSSNSSGLRKGSLGIQGKFIRRERVQLRIEGTGRERGGRGATSNRGNRKGERGKGRNIE